MKKKDTPEKELEGFTVRYTPEIAAIARAALKKIRSRLPGAYELVYDNYNALVSAFSTSEKVGDVILSIALYPRWVTLFFMRGTELPDPRGLLKGSGKTIRHVVLEDGARTLDEPAVKALIANAVKQSRTPLPAGKGKMIIKSISPKQRPRRPG